jgi:hypothetical protein
MKHTDDERTSLRSGVKPGIRKAENNNDADEE